MKLRILVLVFCSSLGLPALAQNINLLPEGQTLISLSVTERSRVTQDTLVASLRVEGEDRDAAALQDRINSTMEEALELAEAMSGLIVSTGAYGVFQSQRQPQGGRADSIWRGSQTLTLETREAQQELLELTAELQALGFAMNELSYRLSNEKADETRDELMESAISRARVKAERAGHALDRPDVEIAVLDVDSGSAASPFSMRTMAVEAAGSSVSTPSARPGETEVSLTVTVQVVAK